MRATNQEIAQLRAAISAFEAQRPILGDAVVDVGVASMREKLAALEAQAGQADQQRKQVTVLFADVSGYTAISETMDAEDVARIMNDLWVLVDEAIIRNGGLIDKHIGDAVMALWGAESAREDDPERAVRAGLDMQAALDDFCKTHNAPLALRIGVNTGPVLLGGVGTTGEITAVGDTVNLASRLEHAASVGSVLISHDTYRHVRGIFDVQTHEPLQVKGKAEPVQGYTVLRAKQRAFRMATRGVEGLETQMIGRDNELGLLQQAYVDAIVAGKTRVVTVVGEAGVGKSRLLYEFDNWIELRPEIVRYFKGRATPPLQNIAYSLFRDLFAYRFDILESDSADVALEKFRQGMADILEPDRADVIGHWLGFDFSSSEAVAQLLGSADFGTVARAHLTRYFRGLAEVKSIVIFLEDIHWADDSSLDLATHLVAAIPDARLLLVTITRPSLFERRSFGAGEQGAFARINLTPLSRVDCEALVNEILRRVKDLTDTLSDLIVDAAEGNPFYVEELVKMLLDQGVFERAETGAEERNGQIREIWRVKEEKLEEVKVPPTLTGLLQARLDGLPRSERVALQRASVIGRLFWDDLVAVLLRAPREEIIPTLDSVRGRELIFRRERSSFAQAEEYIFKHALLRDVTYETVLIKHRAEFHGQVARWLEEHAGQRIGEYFGLIAEHYTQAGDYGPAADYLHRSGEQAARASAFRVARTAFERALELRERQDAPHGNSMIHYLRLGEMNYKLADFPAAEVALGQALTLAREGGDIQAQAEALNWMASVTRSIGNTDAVGQLLEEATALARAVGGATLVSVLSNVATNEWQSGRLDPAEQYANEARRQAASLHDVSLEIHPERTLGIISGLRGEFDRSIRHFETSLALARQIGDRYQESLIESNLGATRHYAGDWAGAVLHYQSAFELGKELGLAESTAIHAHNLADVHSSLGEYEEGRRYAKISLMQAREVGAIPLQLAALIPLAEIMAKQGDGERALRLLGLARNHPGTPQQKQLGIEEALRLVNLSPDEIEAGLAAGAALDLDGVVGEILAHDPV